LIKIRFPVVRVTPSMVDPLANDVARVPAVVVAATTLDLMDRPWIAASAYAFVTASVGFTGVGTVTVPVTVRFPPTYTPFAIPTPPETIRLPVELELASVVSVTDTAPLDVRPVRVPTDVIWDWAAFTESVPEDSVSPVPAVR
jgi:hypothetical protein